LVITRVAYIGFKNKKETYYFLTTIEVGIFIKIRLFESLFDSLISKKKMKKKKQTLILQLGAQNIQLKIFFVFEANFRA